MPYALFYQSLAKKRNWQLLLSHLLMIVYFINVHCISVRFWGMLLILININNHRNIVPPNSFFALFMIQRGFYHIIFLVLYKFISIVNVQFNQYYDSRIKIQTNCKSSITKINIFSKAAEKVKVLITIHSTGHCTRY